MTGVYYTCYNKENRNQILKKITVADPQLFLEYFDNFIIFFF